jgi:hypothetical protein
LNKDQVDRIYKATGWIGVSFCIASLISSPDSIDSIWTKFTGQFHRRPFNISVEGFLALTLHSKVFFYGLPFSIWSPKSSGFIPCGRRKPI